VTQEIASTCRRLPGVQDIRQQDEPDRRPREVGHEANHQGQGTPHGAGVLKAQARPGLGVSIASGSDIKTFRITVRAAERSNSAGRYQPRGAIHLASRGRLFLRHVALVLRRRGCGKARSACPPFECGPRPHPLRSMKRGGLSAYPRSLCVGGSTEGGLWRTKSPCARPTDPFESLPITLHAIPFVCMVYNKRDQYCGSRRLTKRGNTRPMTPTGGGKPPGAASACPATAHARRAMTVQRMRSICSSGERD